MFTRSVNAKFDKDLNPHEATFGSFTYCVKKNKQIEPSLELNLNFHEEDLETVILPTLRASRSNLPILRAHSRKLPKKT